MLGKLVHDGPKTTYIAVNIALCTCCDNFKVYHAILKIKSGNYHPMEQVC